MKIINVEKVKDKKIIIKKISPAAEAIKKGEVVIFPTETVYGIGANCFDEVAVRKVFLVKKRPFYNPLIVHIVRKSQLNKLVKKIDEKVKKLVKAFWPGPLSLVLEKSNVVPRIVTGGLATVCIRMPSNRIARIFLSKCGVPVAAPSANVFSRISSTHINHIKKNFLKSKEVKFVIYDGESEHGLESTILDCTRYPFKVLRYGSISVETIRQKTGLKIVEIKNNFPKAIKSPGLFKKHYSPLKETYVVKDMLKYLVNRDENFLRKVVVVCNGKTEKVILRKFNKKVKVLNYGEKITEIAKKLYSVLHKAEESDREKILIEAVPFKGLGKSLMDRMIKASEGKIIG